jgi:HlyD family type I secretion membrane fusion protein
MINLTNEFMKDVATELKDTQAQIADLEERIRARADKVSRIVITAPLSGIVTGLKVHTVGGVIAPGEKIMDIVPKDDKLIIESKVRTQDIDEVHPGLTAQVRLTAYRSRYVPPLVGTVTYVSADRFQDERTGEPYYTARAEIGADQLEGLENVALYPGMPTEVLIVTGSRSFISYMLDPISSSFNRAFREQ